ncbi:hypothetical protein TeGR_g3742 [Tetraparma gracilis]|uniref:Amino acid transporter transmembrane domain-containing protein n=1 Tax=Tetraparma gracilis TaxID=2962635 RepID=A0ABQ6N5M4_9STRA|nr:hypothetical protein TeGR_g3742 [Tetraparma gracilis]
MLPLAFGLSSRPGSTGFAAAAGIVGAAGVLGWYGLHSMARAREVSGVSGSSLREVHAGLGLPFAWVSTLAPLLLTAGCCLFYSAFVGDIYHSLLSPFSLPRPFVLSLFSSLVLLPLCLLPDLSSLFYSSLVGLAGVLYTALFSLARALDGSYNPGGPRFALMEALDRPDLLSAPLPKTPLFRVSGGTLVLVNMACVAFACHYNGVKYYAELKDRTVRKFSFTMSLSFLSVYAVFLSMMFSGASSFGSAAQPLLLNNYHPSLDRGASAARALTGVAILSGYPLMFAGLKEALFDLLGIRDKGWHPKAAASVLSLALITTLACFVTEHDLGPILGVVGAVFGSAVVYVIPAVWNVRCADSMPLFRGEREFNYLLGAAGVALAVMGTWVTLKEAH